MNDTTKPEQPAKEYAPIPMTQVDSSQIKAIGYDAARKTLACQFTRGPGHVYQYPGVEPEFHTAFMAAESKGKFFGANVKPLPFDKFSAETLAEALGAQTKPAEQATA